MSIVDELIAANQRFAQNFRWGDLPIPPARKVAVVACMDARLPIELMLGLEIGDAHIIRNAGGIVTEDALRSLIISHHLLGTQEFVVINHTDCGMMTFRDEELRARLEQQTGTAAATPAAFHAFRSLEENVRRQVERIRSHPWIPPRVSARGLIYEVKSGSLREVSL